MSAWEGCTTGTIGLRKPNQRSVAKTSRFLHPYIYRYTARSGCSGERFSALEGEGITWMGQRSRQGIAPFSVRIEFWRRTGFNIAYNAALRIATAVLAASGYQAERANHHYRVIDSLSLTLGTDAGSIKKFDIFRKKRNISDYERADTISASDVEEMRSLAEKLRVDFEAWIQKNHPQLKP